jgi:hypothetical protein
MPEPLTKQRFKQIVPNTKEKQNIVMQTEFIAEQVPYAELYVTEDAEFFIDDYDSTGFYATNTKTLEQEYFEYFMVLDDDYFTVKH